ncbi:MAG: VWA domain-containing protein [Gammaproteobacteria bacterium]|nr:VWA domain-containing protein [Gammaproteobacteria bacterium]
MQRIASILIIWGLLLGLAPLAEAAERKHVRVVLDISLSLSKGLKKQGIPPTDEARLAVLSTILLHDLTMFNATSEDTFEVIPFEKNWPGKYGFTKIKHLHSTRPKIKAVYGNREDFVKKLNTLPYNAKNTYFYPGLKRAVNDLIKAPSGKFGTRVIVLVTDGLPETWAQQQESKRIRNKLVPLLAEHNIRLYVLAFGAQAFSHQSYFTPMVKGLSSSELGKVFVDPDGSKLLSNMAHIFGRSFGYTVEPPYSLSGMKTLDLDLEKGVSPDRVAVVVLSPNSPMPVPDLELEHSSGILVNPDGIQEAKETGASYSLRWILAPQKGIYSFKTNISDGFVAILRPTQVVLEIRKPPAKDKQPLTTIMADPHGIPFDILVKPLYGIQSDPGKFKIHFRPIIKPPVNGEKKCEKQYGWCDKIYSPPGVSMLIKEGRVYTAVIKFPKNLMSPHKPYVGHIEVSARREEAEVASLRAANAHPLYVSPYLSLTPFPQNHTIKKALRKGDKEVCTKFSFHQEGLLPHPNNPKYSLRAVAAPGKNIVANALKEAELTLDGFPLEFKSQPVKSGPWSTGCLLNKTGKSEPLYMGCLPKKDAKLLKKKGIKKPGLLSEHELCIRIGKPKAGSSSAPFTVPVKFTLVESPYDDFDVVKSFNLKIQIIAPPLWPWILFSILGALALAALFWYSRNRPSLPPDLHYAFGAEDPSAPGILPETLAKAGDAKTFEETSSVRRLLGLVEEKPIAIDNGDRILAWIRPVKSTEALYCLRLAQDVAFEPLSRQDAPVADGKLFNIEVHRIYRLKTKLKNYLFRIEYRLYE